MLSGVKQPVATMAQGIDTQNNQSNPHQREANPALERHGFAHNGHPKGELHDRSQVLHEPDDGQRQTPGRRPKKEQRMLLM